MALKERATTLTGKGRHLALRGGVAGVALMGGVTAEAQAAHHKLPGLYAHAQEARYFESNAARVQSSGMTDLACQQAIKGGSVKIRPAKNPSTLRFDVRYPAYPEACISPLGPDGELVHPGKAALKGLVARVYEVLPSGKGTELARVEVDGNGDEAAGVNVHKRARYNVTDARGNAYNFCEKPDTQYAVSIDTIGGPDELVDVDEYPLELAPSKGVIRTVDLLAGRPQNIAGAEIFTPDC